MVSDLEWQEWRASEATQEYLQYMEIELSKNATGALRLTSTGETLTRDYYISQGIAAALESCVNFIEAR